jgi:hypothetical protein
LIVEELDAHLRERGRAADLLRAQKMTLGRHHCGRLLAEQAV